VSPIAPEAGCCVVDTTPDGFQIQNAGTYYWVASFNGDSNNNSFTSGCNDEPVVVAPNQPSVSPLLA
jgi:hypothetical protein